MDGAVRFFGIPYAAPTGGQGRFRAPAPRPGWLGALDATGPPQPALQPDPHGSGAIVGTEDCLRLDISVPADSTGPHPVLVWLHGGAFTSGSADEPHTRPRAFCARGIVVVSVRYRLGILGWLRLAAHDPALGDGNLGLLDQIAALHWVRRNIAAFGGDPSQVTLMGQSAGAMSIAALLAAPRAAGTFQRAILQSGAGDHVMTTDEADDLTMRVAAAARAANPLDLMTRPAIELLAAQRSVMIDDARTRNTRFRGARLLTFCPVGGTPTLPVAAVDAVRSSQATLVPVIVGANADEMRAWPDRWVTEATGRSWLEGTGLSVPDRVWDHYGATAGLEPAQVMAAIKTDLFFRLPGVRLARAVAETGCPVWHYDFRWPASLPGVGSAHSLELRFVFGTLDDAAAALTHAGAPAVLAAGIPAAWAAMAAHGRPNLNDCWGENWRSFNDRGETLVLDTEIRHDAEFADSLSAAWGRPRASG